MKKSVFMFAIALVSLQSYAQNVANTTPRVILGEITGAAFPTLTHEDLLTNTTLIVEGSTCKVTGYSFSILPTGHEFQGPYTVTGSNEFTPQIKKIIAALDNSGGRVFIENIRLNCGGAESTAAPIVFKYK